MSFACDAFVPPRPLSVCNLVLTDAQRHRGLPERVAAWQPRAGVPMPRQVIADQRKRWGSCDRNGTIRLNWRIIQAPMRLVDYVVVQELVHLRHRGHGATTGRHSAASCRTASGGGTS